MTEALSLELGTHRGAEELTFHLNRVFDALINELHHYSGSVIGFSGDALTCWIDGDDGRAAASCCLGMQQAMAQFAEITIPGSKPVSLALKTAVATGTARRFAVGNPEHQVFDALVGSTLDRLAAAEKLASPGEVILDPTTVASLGEAAHIIELRQSKGTADLFGVLDRLAEPVPFVEWPAVPDSALSDDQVRPWLPPVVFHRLVSGQGEFLGEFRPALSLFVRFTGIDYDGDEEAPAMLDNYIRQVQTVLARYDGALIQLTFGDKGSYYYAAFGAPIAHEDDAVRAVSAAHDLQAIGNTIDYIGDVQIGITQGRVLTGAYGAIVRRTYGVLGDIVNLSARLMVASVPGQILVNERVRQRTELAFNWKPLPAIKVKGKSEPVTLFELQGAIAQRGQYLQESRYALPMVGREKELALIDRKLSAALDGYGHVILIVADAGIGKSRLIAEVIERARSLGLRIFGGQCESYGTNTSYLVWQSIWRGLFEVNPSLSHDEQIRALEDQLSKIDESLLPRLPLLGPVLNLTIADNELTRSLDAKLRKSSLEALLADCLRAKAAEQPLLIVLEDCHWMDSLSRDLLEVIANAIEDTPIVLITSYRSVSELDAAKLHLGDNGHATRIKLEVFTPHEAAELIDLKLRQLYGADAEASASLFERVTTLAEGNPFYVEEMLNYLQKEGAVTTDRQPFDRSDLPTSLYSLILSRVDQLDETQRTLVRVASVIGRQFEAAMVYGVYPMLGDWNEVKEHFDYLTRADLTIPDRPAPELAYLFKQIITQEVIYENLPFATRAMLHEQVGLYLETNRAELIQRYIDLLAYHYDRSRNEEKKRRYLLQAGEAAQAAYANTAAIDYYERLLPLLPDEEKVAVMLKLGDVLQLVGDWPEAAELYEETLSLADTLGDRHALAHAQLAKAELLRKRGEYIAASSWQESARQGFELLDDRAGVGQVLHYAGTLAAQQGDLETANELYTESLGIRRTLHDEPNIASLTSNLGIIARMQGDYDTARPLYEESLAIRERLGDKWGIGVSLNNLGLLALEQQDFETACDLLERAVELQREIGDRWFTANALHNLGNAMRAQGDFVTASSLYQQSLKINQQLGDGRSIAFLLEDIGCMAAEQGRPNRALRLAGAAETLRESVGAPLPPVDQAKLKRCLEQARRALGDTEADEIAASGRTIPLEAAIEEALS